MKKGYQRKVFSLILVLVLCIGMISGCNKKDSTDTGSDVTQTPTDNGDTGENGDTPLVVGYSPFNEKFSPFFATTQYDMDVAEVTNVKMLTTDRLGAVVYNAIEGETREYNGTDYTYKGISDIKVDIDEKSNITTYTITIRDDVKFSDGHVMDADDVIFTMYALADIDYDGSASLYSKPIIGMKNYRANNSQAENVTKKQIEKKLQNPSKELKEKIHNEVIVKTLTEELEFARSCYGKDEYKEQTEKYPEVKDFFASIYNIDTTYDSTKEASEENVLQAIIKQYGTDYVTLAKNYAGDETHFNSMVEGFISQEIYDELKAEGAKDVRNIEGIKKLSQNSIEVKTKGFDATTIYGLDFLVAPMHYYGDATTYDYDKNQFGFTRGDLSALRAKTTEPMGAGPYKFIKFENKVIYFEANENYYKGCPKTKYLQFKETVDADNIAGVGTGTIDIANPSGSVERFEEIRGYNSNKELSGDTITTSLVDNLGYGYIGINAHNVNVGGEYGSDASKNLRRGFATLLAVYRDVAIDSYYGDVATIINYPISNTSWAAPQKTDEGYEIAFSTDINKAPLYTSEMTADEKYEKALNATIEYFKAAGYTFDDATGKFIKAPAGAKLEYTALIGGDGQGNHPSFAILTAVREALEKIGITLTIKDPANGSDVWDILDANNGEIWCAAWQATEDPDMYQIYYSTNAIGLGGTESNKYFLQDKELDTLIMDARKSSDQEYRKTVYKSCLDIIVDWAVEIPVYQRQNCVTFSSKRVNMDTVTPDISTFYDWKLEIENVEMK